MDCKPERKRRAPKGTLGKQKLTKKGGRELLLLLPGTMPLDDMVDAVVRCFLAHAEREKKRRG